MSTTKDTIDYTVRTDETDPDNVYVGRAYPGSQENKAVWQIQKIVKAGAITKVLWPSPILGTGGAPNSFGFTWSNRAALIYS
jgi:hypothetical protein